MSRSNIFTVQQELKNIVSYLLLDQSDRQDYFDTDPTYYDVEVPYDQVHYPEYIWDSLVDLSMYNHRFYHIYDVQTEIIAERVVRE